MQLAGPHTIEVVSEDRWASRAADVFATAISTAVELRGHCVLALSGGSTPMPVFLELGKRELPWEDVVITQVDERVAPEGSPQRNLVGQKEALGHLPVEWLPLSVEGPIRRQIENMLHSLGKVAGDPAVLDVVHLGLGEDGHTASLIPGDDVLEETERTLALTGEYQGTRRLTFTRPMLDRARLTVWLVKGEEKALALQALVNGSETIPASLLKPQNSLVIADEAAASLLN